MRGRRGRGRGRGRGKSRVLVDLSVAAENTNDTGVDTGLGMLASIKIEPVDEGDDDSGAVFDPFGDTASELGSRVGCIDKLESLLDSTQGSAAPPARTPRPKTRTEIPPPSRASSRIRAKRERKLTEKHDSPPPPVKKKRQYKRRKPVYGPPQLELLGLSEIKQEVPDVPEEIGFSEFEFGLGRIKQERISPDITIAHRIDQGCYGDKRGETEKVKGSRAPDFSDLAFGGPRNNDIKKLICDVDDDDDVVVKEMPAPPAPMPVALVRFESSPEIVAAQCAEAKRIVADMNSIDARVLDESPVIRRAINSLQTLSEVLVPSLLDSTRTLSVHSRVLRETLSETAAAQQQLMAENEKMRMAQRELTETCERERNRASLAWNERDRVSMAVKVSDKSKEQIGIGRLYSEALDKNNVKMENLIKEHEKAVGDLSKTNDRLNRSVAAGEKKLKGVKRRVKVCCGVFRGVGLGWVVDEYVYGNKGGVDEVVNEVVERVKRGGGVKVSGGGGDGGGQVELDKDRGLTSDEDEFVDVDDGGGGDEGEELEGREGMDGIEEIFVEREEVCGGDDDDEGVGEAQSFDGGEMEIGQVEGGLEVKGHGGVGMNKPEAEIILEENDGVEEMLEEVKEPEGMVQEEIKEPERVVQEEIKELESVVQEEIKELESVVQLEVKEPENVFQVEVKEPERVVQVAVKEPESVVQLEIKEQMEVEEPENLSTLGRAPELLTKVPDIHDNVTPPSFLSDQEDDYETSEHCVDPPFAEILFETRDHGDVDMRVGGSWGVEYVSPDEPKAVSLSSVSSADMSPENKSPGDEEENPFIGYDEWDSDKDEIEDPPCMVIEDRRGGSRFERKRAYRSSGDREYGHSSRRYGQGHYDRGGRRFHDHRGHRSSNESLSSRLKYGATEPLAVGSTSKCEKMKLAEQISAKASEWKDVAQGKAYRGAKRPKRDRKRDRESRKRVSDYSMDFLFEEDGGEGKDKDKERDGKAVDAGNQGDGKAVDAGNQGDGKGVDAGNQGDGKGVDAGNQGDGKAVAAGNQGDGKAVAAGNQGDGKAVATSNQHDQVAVGNQRKENGEAIVSSPSVSPASTPPSSDDEYADLNKDLALSDSDEEDVGGPSLAANVVIAPARLLPPQHVSSEQVTGTSASKNMTTVANDNEMVFKTPQAPPPRGMQSMASSSSAAFKLPLPRSIETMSMHAVIEPRHLQQPHQIVALTGSGLTEAQLLHAVSLVTLPLDHLLKNSTPIEQLERTLSPMQSAYILTLSLMETQQTDLQSRPFQEPRVTRCPLIPRFQSILYSLKLMSNHASVWALVLRNLEVAVYPHSNNQILQDDQFLNNLGRFAGAVATEWKAPDFGKNHLIKFFAYMGPYSYSFAMGLLCSCCEVLGWSSDLTKFHDLSPVSRGIIMMLCKSARFGDYWKAGTLLDFIKKALGVQYPDITLEQFLRNVVDEMKNGGTGGSGAKNEYVQVIGACISHLGCDWLVNSYVGIVDAFLDGFDSVTGVDATHLYDMLVVLVHGIAVGITCFRHDDVPKDISTIIDGVHAFTKLTCITENHCAELERSVKALNNIRVLPADSRERTKWVYKRWYDDINQRNRSRDRGRGGGERGRNSNERGRSSNERGRSSNERGRSSNERGRSTNERGRGNNHRGSPGAQFQQRAGVMPPPPGIHDGFWVKGEAAPPPVRGEMNRGRGSRGGRGGRGGSRGGRGNQRGGGGRGRGRGQHAPRIES